MEIQVCHKLWANSCIHDFEQNLPDLEQGLMYWAMSDYSRAANFWSTTELLADVRLPKSTEIVPFSLKWNTNKNHNEFASLLGHLPATLLWCMSHAQGLARKKVIAHHFPCAICRGLSFVIECLVTLDMNLPQLINLGIGQPLPLFRLSVLAHKTFLVSTNSCYPPPRMQWLQHVMGENEVAF